MVLPVVAAAAARTAATAAVRAGAGTAARTGAAATARAGASVGKAGGAASRATSSGAAVQGNADIGASRVIPTNGARSQTAGGGYARNASAERASVREVPTGERGTAGRQGGGGESEVSPRQADGERRQASRQDAADRTQRGTERSSSTTRAEEEEEAYEPKMDSADLIPFLIVAIIIDALQIVSALLVFGAVTAVISYIVGFFLGVAAWIIFGLWFTFKGISIFSGRKLVMTGVTFLADTVFAGFIPNWTVTVIYIYLNEQALARGVDATKVIKKLM